jgi:hypothetical protein
MVPRKNPITRIRLFFFLFSFFFSITDLKGKYKIFIGDINILICDFEGQEIGRVLCISFVEYSFVNK